MLSSIHPDGSVLFVGTDCFVDGNQLMRDRISFLPHPQLVWTAMDVFHDMNLTLMFQKGQARGVIGEPPLPGVVVYGQAHKLHERRTRTAFGIILRIRPRRGPDAR